MACLGELGSYANRKFWWIYSHRQCRAGMVDFGGGWITNADEYIEGRMSISEEGFIDAFVKFLLTMSLMKSTVYHSNILGLGKIIWSY